MFESKRIIDICFPIRDRMVVYPGTPQVQINTFAGTTTWNSTITFGSHTGTHIDAPKHVDIENTSIDQLDLHSLMGPCQVLDFTFSTESITLEDIKTKDILPNQRILLKTTNSERSRKVFHNDYIYLSGDAAQYLSNLPLTLIGIDYFSIKQRGSSDTRAHDLFLDHNVPILEAINLNNVSEGEYTLIALPLRFEGLEASPARVLLLSDRK